MQPILEYRDYRRRYLQVEDKLRATDMGRNHQVQNVAAATPAAAPSLLSGDFHVGQLWLSHVEERVSCLRVEPRHCYI